MAAILSLPQCVNLCQAITVSADISTFRTFRLGHMQISVVIAGDSISIIYTHPHVHWDDQVKCTLISRFIGPTWGPSGADRTQMGPMLAQWTLLSGVVSPTQKMNLIHLHISSDGAFCTSHNVWNQEDTFSWRIVIDVHYNKNVKHYKSQIMHKVKQLLKNIHAFSSLLKDVID